MEFLSAYQFKLVWRRAPRRKITDFLSSSTCGYYPIGHRGLQPLDEYLVGTSGLEPSVINSNRANSQTSISDARAFFYRSQTFPLVALRDEDVKDPCFLCDTSKVPYLPCLSASNEANMDILLASLPLARRISQRKRLRTALSRGDNHLSRPTPSRLPSCLEEQTPMPGSDSPKANTLSLDSPEDSGPEATAGIQAPTSPQVKRALSAPGDTRGWQSSSVACAEDIQGCSAVASSDSS